MSSTQPIEHPQQTPANSDSEAQQFAYICSHDLNAPLRAVSGFMQLLMAEYADRLDAQGRDWMQRALDSTQKMQAMLDDLRIYSRLKPPPTNAPPTALDAVLDDVLLELGVSVRELGATVTRTALPTVPGDIAQLTMLLKQLVDNALKYHGASPPRIHVSAEDHGDRWVVAVADNGLGIEPKHHQRIFEIFKRLHQDAYPGRGIGLSLARRVVELHGGAISVESTFGAGATFRFTLPKGNPS